MAYQQQTPVEMIDHFEQILDEQFEYHRISQGENAKFIVAVEVRN